MRSVIKKNIAAGIIGPLMLFPALVLAGIFMAVYDAESKSDLYKSGDFSILTDAVITFGGFALYGLIFAYPLTIFFGLPIAALLKKIGFFNLPILLLVSLIPESIMFGIFETTFLWVCIFGCRIGLLVFLQVGIKAIKGNYGLKIEKL